MTERTELLNKLKKLIPAQFEEVLFRLGIDKAHIPPDTVAQSLRAIEVIKLLEQESNGLEPLEILLADNMGISVTTSQFQTLIKDKTKDFVGREYVFDAIQAFIQENQKGYLTIIADPGMGKSAILAKYVQDTECIAHFNEQLKGRNRADQFLESICKQLIARYQLSYYLKSSVEGAQYKVKSTGSIKYPSKETSAL